MKRSSFVHTPLRKWSALLVLLSIFVVLPYFAVEAEAGKTFLWEVKSDTATAYILGSIHFLKESMYPLDSAIENAFNKADTLVVEVDISGSDAAKIQEMMLMNSLYSDGSTLRDHVSSDTFDLAKKTFDELGVPLETVQILRPWALALTLTTIELMKLGYDQEHGIDKYFLGKARTGKKIVALESAEFQVSLLSGLSDEDQEAFLAYTIKDLNKMSESVEDMVKAWTSGDGDALESVLLQNVKDYPRFEYIYEKLIYDRNKTMTEKIDGYLKDKGTYFVVVGAGHLVGKRGIINSLKDKGYKVSQQ